MKQFKIIISILFLLPIILIGLEKTDSLKEVDIILNQKIPMRDGINLSGTIYKPSNLKDPLPVIFVLTPYISDENQQRGIFFAKNGYVFVSVDCRGRGNSEGEFFPFEKDGKDGYDICSWLSKQPWCNGKIAMLGGSYRGTAQWLTLKEMPPNLKTIVPTAAASPGIDFPGRNNIFYTYDAQWLAFTSGKTLNRRLFADQKYWKIKFLKLFKEHIPYSKLDKITGISGRIFQKWLKHPAFDNYWKSIVPSKEDYKKFNIPILTITGYFDGDQPGAMEYYKNFMKYAAEEAKNKHYLIIGPWDHAGTRHPKKELGGLKFGDNSVIDMNKLHLEWFNWILKGDKKPEFLKNKVCYYVMGINEWKYTDKLENVSNKILKLYLCSENGRANDVFHSGKLIKIPPREQKPDTFKYDPLDISPANNYLLEKPNYLLDQSEAFKKDKLIYHSPPFEKDTEISGYVKLKLYISMNVPDTDFQVFLYEIKPDGKSIYLTSDVMRARYRKSLEKEELVKPGKIEVYNFKTFYFFSRTISKGSRLRLVISCINSPNWQKNYNSGGVVAEETAKDAKIAIITLYHDEKYPSCLELPVFKKD